jgi:phage-related protein
MSWSTRRSVGLRKAGSSVQRVLGTFSDFLGSYSGIVELVKAADSQYGGLAYGTLSLLLSVSCIAKIEIAG